MLSSMNGTWFYNYLKNSIFSNVSAPDIEDKVLGEPYIQLIEQKPYSRKIFEN